MDVEILYKDKFLVLCVKPVGIVSEEGGMPEILRSQLGGEIYPVHRLDRAVSGLMVYARTKAAAAKLSELVANSGLHKTYLAVVQGRPEEDSGCYKDLLFKDSSKNKSYVVKRMRKGVKEAALNYRVVAENGEMSLLEVELLTGRSHQIRVQFSSRKMPLAGDIKYGSKLRDCDIALYSSGLKFIHPFTGKAVAFSHMPPDIYPWQEFLKKENEKNGKNL